MAELNFTIRTGKPSDIAATLDLIKQLAAYEREADQVEIDAEQLHEDIFGSGQALGRGLLIAELEGKIEGCAIFYLKYSTWKGTCLHLEDLIVTKKMRGLGMGKALFEAVILESKSKGAKRMEWQVLDWNEPAIAFYKKYNTDFLKGWLNCRLTADQIDNFQAE